MSEFRRLLDRRGPGPGDAGRRWAFVPYDQLTERVGPLAGADPAELGIVLVESPWKAARRPYHKQKLALVLANQRHFALEQAERGVAVRHVVAEGPFREALRPLAAELGPLRVMEPAERELRVDLAPLVEEGALERVPHAGWLTTEEQFRESQDGPPWRMDVFYRHVRRTTGILMEDGAPEGGRYSFDPENRRPWPGEPEPPPPPAFPTDAVKEEVAALVEERFADHPGSVDPERLPATRADAEALWRRALEECLEHFGPFEDAMSARSAGLFHTRVSPLLNLHRLLPERVVREAAAAAAPLASREGLVRQVLGWREFVRHVHRETDGFRRRLPGSTRREAHGEDSPGGDERAEADADATGGTDREAAARKALAGPGAAPSVLGAGAPLPPAWWGAPSGLRCLDTVVEEVWATGWSHHITRLMVLSNIATLLDVSPRELTDWFWEAYVDAYDWVVEPNVLAMGTFGAGGLMTTKPYVSGAAYIDRMSDYCGQCRFDPGEDCPLTPLYWAFLARHREALGDVPRMRLQLASLGRRDEARQRRDAEVFERVTAALAEGRELSPARVAGEADG